MILPPCTQGVQVQVTMEGTFEQVVATHLWRNSICLVDETTAKAQAQLIQLG